MRGSSSAGMFFVRAPRYAAVWGTSVARWLATALIVLCGLCVAPLASAQDLAQDAPTTSSRSDGSEVMKDFVALEQANRQEGELTTKERHTIMFVMGVSLLVLLLATAYFGIAMAVMGKPLFIPHMLCAGLSITLAIAHSVVAVVWFYPF